MTPTPDDAMPDVIYASDNNLEFPGLWVRKEDADESDTRYIRADKPHAEAVRVLVEALRTYNRGVDVEALKDKAPDGHKQDCICIRCERKNAWNDCLDHLSARGLLRTTPENAKGVILGYLHEVTEPDGQYHKMYSAQEESPWKHWKEDHQAGCRYKRTALFGATQQPEHESN